MELPNEIYQLQHCCTHPFYYNINPASKIVFSSCSLFSFFFFCPPLHSFLFTSVSIICTSVMHYDTSSVFRCVYCTKTIADCKLTVMKLLLQCSGFAASHLRLGEEPFFRKFFPPDSITNSSLTVCHLYDGLCFYDLLSGLIDSDVLFNIKQYRKYIFHFFLKTITAFI